MTEPTDDEIEVRDRATLFMVEAALKKIYERNDDDYPSSLALLTALSACLELPRWVAEA